MFTLKKVKYKDILNIPLLNIKENAVTSIVGESGSGKTTLLKLLNKMITQDSGDIFYKNTSLNEIDSVDLRREVVMLPQTPTIYDGTIKDNLLIGLKFSKKPMATDEELTKVLQTVKLQKDINQDAQNLSGGEKQRLALARVILLNPSVLLLDEPSSALDDETENFIITAVVNFTRSTNKTLIMVTHSKNIAKNFSDEIINISKGSIV